MPARDGVPLRADVWRPGGPGRYPVLLVRTPYDKRQASLVNYTHPHWYAAQGFIVAIQDVRGRWASDGDEFTPFEHEQEDGHDAVAWAAALPGSTGRVGMYGGSYVGATQLLAARGAPAELRAIAPGVTSSQYFEGWPYQQGAFALAMNASWVSELAADQARRAGDEAAWRLLAAAADTPGTWYPYLPLDEHPPLAAGRFEPYFEWLRHPTYDDYWRRWSIDEDYSSIRAAGLHYGGWWDSFATGTVRNFTGLTAAGRAPQRLLMGPWQHVAWSARTGDVDHGPAAAPEIDQAQLAFFDRHLRDGDGDGEADVRVFVPGLGSWLSESRWPIPGGEEQRLFLSSGGRANSVRGDGRLTLDPPASGQPPDVYVYDPLAPTPSLGGHSCCYPALSPIGPRDQTDVESSGRVLIYTGAPLEHDLLIAGAVSVELYAATDRHDTDFAARLCEVDEGGRSLNLLEGIVRARYRNGTAAASLLEPGAVHRYEIGLGTVAHWFRRGHRVRLQVRSSDFPQWDRNLNTGGELGAEGPLAALVATQSVFPDDRHRSRLRLPVLPLSG